MALVMLPMYNGAVGDGVHVVKVMVVLSNRASEV